MTSARDIITAGAEQYSLTLGPADAEKQLAPLAGVLVDDRAVEAAVLLANIGLTVDGWRRLADLVSLGSQRLARKEASNG